MLIFGDAFGTTMLPNCLALLIAREVARDAAGGVNITNVLNELSLPRFPYSLTIGVFLELAGIHGEVPITLRLAHVDSFPGDKAIEIKGVVHAADPIGTVQSTVVLHATFHRPGVYLLELWAQEEIIQTRRLTVGLKK